MTAVDARRYSHPPVSDAEDIHAALERLGLVPPGSRPRLTPLPGGVSSDIWRADLPTGTVCVKRALARLKVAQDWRAPVSRNANEVEWMREAARAVPGVSPRLIAADARAGK